MKHFKAILITIFFVFSNLFALDNEEFRATWVITWEHNCDSTTIKQILDNHVKANMNAVLFQVRQGGTAYYPSSYEPWGFYADYSDPGFDPLAFAIEEAHKRGLELHAWFNAFHTSSTIPGAPAQEHPEWICRDGDGNPMPQHIAISPGLQEVRDYTLDVIMEIVNQYDIDGMHLDYIRWNEYTTTSVLEKSAGKDIDKLDGEISTHEKELLQKATSANRYLYDVNHKYSDGVPEGYGSWEEFWRSSVTTFVRSVHDSIQATKPHVRLSVAALGNYRWGGWQGYESVYQDAGLWYNEGSIDQLTPMHYHWTDGDGFYSMLNGYGSTNWDYWLDDDSRVLFSVGPGSYILSENNIWNRHPEIIERSRTVDFVDGFQFFSYGSWQGNEYWEEAGKTVFPTKTKIPKNELYTGPIPAEPQISLQKYNSLVYNITITPPEQETEKRWYVVYRSTDATIEPEQDPIVAMKLTNEPFDVKEEFDGNQTFNGQYTYGATTLNRFWFESEMSNLQVTDSVPSYPPVITNVTPAEADSITVNPTIIFEFSKEIDLSSFESAFTITPTVESKSFEISDQWNDANKIVTVDLSGLDFATEYVISLNENLTDLNGTMLDGDFDGTPGGIFTIKYRTYNVDTKAPEIVTSFPSENQMNIDPEGVWSLVFDELIDPESAQKSISVFNNGREISADILVSEMDNRSLVNFKTKSSLMSDSYVEYRVSQELSDTAGNALGEDVTINAKTANYHYSEVVVLDDFTGDSEWWDPEGSGSTQGTYDARTTFTFVNYIYMPGYNNNKSGRIRYKWDLSHEGEFLIRDHAASGPLVTTHIDTSYTMQCYLYGDGSNNKFRFALYEKDGGQTAEVSQWTTIDWIGWKLVEWDLGDSTQVGEWLGNGVFDGGYYVVDGVHLTRDENSAQEGMIYIDEMRIVKKTPGQPADNHAPVVEAIEDATIESGEYHKIYVNYTDEDENDNHEIIAKADTAAIAFSIKGHESGDRVYCVPSADFVGSSVITIIVKDYGIGELTDTTQFTLTVTPTTATDDEKVVREYALSQNYPNPFNPSTTIDFALPKRDKIRINVYDMRGNMVKTLINSEYDAGRYRVDFDARGLASGVYIYQMHTGAKTITKKMMLLK